MRERASVRFRKFHQASRREGETLREFLIRLDAAIARALRDGEFTREINASD